MTQEMWSPHRGPGSGSETAVAEAFTKWLTDQGWQCADIPPHGDHPGIKAAHPDGRHLIAEAKGVTRASDTDLDAAYGQLLRRMDADPGTAYALVVSKKVLWWAQRVPSAVRARLGIALYSVDFHGNVEHVDGMAV